MFVLASCGERTVELPASSGSSSATPPPEHPPETIYSLELDAGVDFYPLAIIDEAAARGKAHYRMRREGGRIRRIERVDPAGKVQETREITYDAAGTRTVEVTDGRGVRRATVRRTKEGVETRRARTGSPLAFGCTELRYVSNERGDDQVRTCRDAEGREIIDSKGCEQVAWVVDDAHRTLEARCARQDGSPTLDASGVHLTKFAHDAAGRVARRSYFDEASRPTADAGGCHGAGYEYDDAGLVKVEWCLGPLGKPVPFRFGTHAGYRRLYDVHGCLAQEELIDADARPATLGKRAGTRYTNDAHCGALSIETFGADGALVSDGVQPPRSEYTLDPSGDAVEQRCLGVKGKPTACIVASPTGGTTRRYTLDDRGLSVREQAFGAGGEPTVHSSGYPHEWRNRFDDRGQLVETQYLDAAGKPTTALGKVAKRTFSYDARGQQVSMKEFGVDDAPVEGTLGLSRGSSSIASRKPS